MVRAVQGASSASVGANDFTFRDLDAKGTLEEPELVSVAKQNMQSVES
jgi:hypothetical protein